MKSILHTRAKRCLVLALTNLALLIFVMGLTNPSFADGTDASLNNAIHELKFDRIENKTFLELYPFFQKDFADASLIEASSGIEAYRASIPLQSNSKIELFYIMSRTHCGTLGCALRAYISKGKAVVDTRLNLVVQRPLYVYNCKNMVSLFFKNFNSEMEFTEWKFNGDNFKMDKKYKSVKDLPTCKQQQ
jgi:hypothetical protein